MAPKEVRYLVPFVSPFESCIVADRQGFQSEEIPKSKRLPRHQWLRNCYFVSCNRLKHSMLPGTEMLLAIKVSVDKYWWKQNWRLPSNLAWIATLWNTVLGIWIDLWELPICNPHLPPMDIFPNTHLDDKNCMSIEHPRLLPAMPWQMFLYQRHKTKNK